MTLADFWHISMGRADTGKILDLAAEGVACDRSVGHLAEKVGVRNVAEIVIEIDL